MVRRFPSLDILDMEAIPKIGFDAPAASTSAVASTSQATATTFPAEMGLSFITGVDSSVVSNFLVRYVLASCARVDYSHASSDFFPYSTTSVPDCWMSTIQTRHSPSLPTQPFPRVRELKGTITRRKCQTSASWSGPRG